MSCPLLFGELVATNANKDLPVVWFGDRKAVTTDIGSVGFEVFGDSQPPAVLRLEWSVDKPALWEPVLACHSEVRKFLAGCFNGDEKSQTLLRLSSGNGYSMYLAVARATESP